MGSSDDFVEIVANSDDEFSDDSDDYEFDKREPRDSRYYCNVIYRNFGMIGMNFCRFDVVYFFELLWRKGGEGKEFNFWLPETLVFLNDRCTGRHSCKKKNSLIT